MEYNKIKNHMRIGVVGSGYVGLVTGAMFSTINHEVICIDADETKIEKLKTGDPIIYEEKLGDILKEALLDKRITFSTNYLDLKNCEAVLICVGTPPKVDGSAELAYVKNSILEAAQNIDSSSIIIIKSTVPPGTCKEMEKCLRDNGYKHQIASNPEFLREGSAVFDFQNPDRLVFGASCEKSFEILRRIYDPQIKEGVPAIETDTTTSEMIKYTSNSFLAIKLSFINEMANLCEYVDADIDELAKGVGLDKRIGELFLKAGPGYGGSCFPKDTSALSNLAASYNCRSAILDSAISSNIARYSMMRDKIKNILGDSREIAIFGVAFKDNTDDVRKSPSIEIIKLLIQDGFKISVYDPVALENFKNLNIKDIEIANSQEEAAKNKDAIVILTEWKEFAKIDWNKMAEAMNGRILIDLRKIADETAAKNAGFKYYTIGKKHSDIGA